MKECPHCYGGYHFGTYEQDGYEVNEEIRCEVCGGTGLRERVKREGQPLLAQALPLSEPEPFDVWEARRERQREEYMSRLES